MDAIRCAMFVLSISSLGRSAVHVRTHKTSRASSSSPVSMRGHAPSNSRIHARRYEQKARKLEAHKSAPVPQVCHEPAAPTQYASGKGQEERGGPCALAAGRWRRGGRWRVHTSARGCFTPCAATCRTRRRVHTLRGHVPHEEACSHLARPRAARGGVRKVGIAQRCTRAAR